MDEKNYTGLIPENVDGREITAASQCDLKNEKEAKDMYRMAKDRLLAVQKWHDWAGSWTAHFQIADAEGKVVNRMVKKGDHFCIDIPGPGNPGGEGHDWVRVEDVKEVNEKNVDSIAIRVRPASNPHTSSPDIAHFYTPQSTSTFVVTREGKTVTASIYDRNIEANDENKDMVDKLRNTVIGLGAKHGFSRLQWEALVKGLLQQ